jgi:hypothetical protein
MLRLPVFVFFAMVLGAGVLHGRMTARWAPRADFPGIQARLDAIPTVVDGWEGRPQAIDEQELQAARVQAHFSRVYTDPKSGRQLSVVVVCGAAGPISAHTPDVCVVGLGYQVVGGRKSMKLSEAETLWCSQFVKTGLVQSRMNVYWGYNGGTGWAAWNQDESRVRNAFRPCLYKVYYALGVSEADATAQEQTLPDPIPTLSRMFESVCGTPSGSPPAGG